MLRAKKYVRVAVRHENALFCDRVNPKELQRRAPPAADAASWSRGSGRRVQAERGTMRAPQPASAGAWRSHIATNPFFERVEFLDTLKPLTGGQGLDVWQGHSTAVLLMRYCKSAWAGGVYTCPWSVPVNRSSPYCQPVSVVNTSGCQSSPDSGTVANSARPGS